MKPDDRVRLMHMIDAASEALGFIQGRSRADLDSDRMLTLALVRSIEVIGEAASKVSTDLRSEYRDVPWSEIIGMRHKLIHGYFDINLNVLWSTLTIDLPELERQLQSILLDHSGNSK
jgi:uncharacterized protein with HEPN domain